MMAKIRIIAIPPGQAPKWVRQQWVGLEFPIAENIPSPENSIQIGVVFGNLEDTDGYPVEAKLAVEILEKKSPEAAQWWKENSLVSLRRSWLVFKKEVCKLI